MAVNLSPVGGVAAQFFDNNGVILTGGKIYTYTAGSSTPQTTYTSNTGSAAHSNPIILDASGRVPGGEIWLTDGLSYKFVIKDANEVLIGTYDNIVGINSNFINYTGEQEIQTATANQTVFTLTTMQYQPGTNSLSVFVDGVNQYGPGAQYAYVETSSTVVTFVTGLHVGASVKFTTATINSSSYGDASQISYTPAGVGAVVTNVQDKLRQYVSAVDFGAVGDGVTDNATAFAAIKTAAESGVYINFPKPAVSYATSVPFNFTVPVNITADPETRIKLTAAANYVIQFDYTGGGGFFDHGGMLTNFILDGNGLAADGLSLKAVISASFENIRTTNITNAGLHLWWAQLCNFTNFTCSDNVDGFTTVPINGVLADTASSSANTFINLVVEKVSGSGMWAKALINSVIVCGTIEGNNIGIELGEASGALTAIGNTFIGTDLEVNAVGDIYILNTGGGNNFLSINAGFQSGPCLIQSSEGNYFSGGFLGGIEFDATAKRNIMVGVEFIGATATLVDNGTDNTWTDIYNISTATTIVAKGSGRNGIVLSNGQTATIDASRYGYNAITCTGATATIAAPTNIRDGQELVICIHNNSVGALTITWNAIFQFSGWVNPGVQTNRTIVFRYDANFVKWYMVSVTAADVQNY
jgi:hypothetical protein